MELAGLYRAGQQADEELALLSQVEAQLTVESGLLLRLAELHANIGDREGAIGVLMRPDVLSARTQLSSNGDTRIFLAKLLVESGRSAEAVRWGKQWISQWREPWLANRLLRGVVLEAPVADASELADAVALAHPEIRLYLVHGLTTMGAKPVARHLLETWLEANPSASMNEIAGFLTACRDQDEPGIVWQAFGEVLGRSSSTDVIMRFSEAIAAEFGIGALAPFWAKLPRSLTEQRPLLVARLAYHEHNLTLAKRLLEKADLTALETFERRMWIDLLTAVASPAEAFAVLRDRRHGDGLPPDLLAPYARLAGGLGQEIEYRTALADLRRKADQEQGK
jgi:hypothetical protein